MYENDVIQKVKIGSLDINDNFFSSLREAYSPNFESWFQKKNNEEAYIFKDNGVLDGFLYLKDEDEEDKSISPILPKRRRLKIGTFKINSHGTVLGQRFMGIILAHMIQNDFPEVYVTFFPEQEGLIKLFEKFGFQYYGTKENGELVYLKNREISDDPYLDYPRVCTEGRSKYIVGIYPQFHTKMFPDSRLNTEKTHFVEDLSFTNTIEKIYITSMRDISKLKVNDLIVIYRTKEPQAKSAEYSAVATSICTVTGFKAMSEFSSVEDYLNYCGKGSIFSETELRKFYRERKYPFIVKMLYNFPLAKRIIRKDLIEKVGIDREAYAGFVPLDDQQFKKIIELGGVNEGFIID